MTKQTHNSMYGNGMLMAVKENMINGEASFAPYSFGVCVL